MTVELESLAELEAVLDGAETTAQVFIGYGAIASSAPEPCRLPKIAVTFDPPRDTGGSYAIGDWHPTWNERDYVDAIDVVRGAIYEGDVYQVNLVQHLRASFSGDPLALARALAPLRPLEPRPMTGDGWTIVSASP
jgi:para-aminobenzoate synthetase component I